MEEQKQPTEESVSSDLELITNTKKQQTSHDHFGIQTFNSDVGKAMKDMNVSLVGIALAEQQKKQEEKTVEKKEATINYIYIFSAVILFIGAIVLAVFVTVNKEELVAPDGIPEVTIPGYQLMVAEERQALEISNITRAELIRVFAKETQKIRTPNTASEFVVWSRAEQGPKVVSLKDILKALSPNVPESIRSSVQDAYAFVVVPGENGFIAGVLLSVDPLYNVTDAFREWEVTFLEDWATVLGLPVDTQEENLFTKEFTDTIIANKDTRLLAKKDGTPVILYSELRSDLVLITSSEAALVEIFRRVNLESLK